MAKKPTYEELELQVKELEKQAVERRRAEEALKESEEKYRQLFQNESDAVMILDAETLQFEDANKVTLDLYGYSKEEFLALNVEDISAEKEKTRIAVQKVKDDEPSSKWVPLRYFRKKDGTTFPGEICVGAFFSGGRKKIIGAVRDITERKQAEEALKGAHEELERRVQERTAELAKANKQLRQEIRERKHAKESLEQSNIAMLDIVESIGDGFFSLDDQFVVTYFNRAAERLLGRKSWEVLGHNFFEAFPECKGSIFEDRFTAVVNEKNSLSFETYFDVKPYENWYQVRVYPQKNGITVYFQVTTERKRAEEEKKKLEAQLQQARKMKAISALAGGIANDFNNLLSVIEGNASLMLFNIDAAHPHYENLKSIEKQAQSGSRFSAQLLGHAGKGRYEVKPLNLNQLLEETSEAFGRTRKEITIHRELADDLFATEADRGQIEQVLSNLYTNAADAMPGGGDLFLKTRNVTHKDMEGKLYDPKPGNYLMLTVADTGAGMDEKTLERIFEPFFTTKETGKGTGLGLSSAYGIIEGHGGYIDVDSSKGHGTTFTICLRASEKRGEKTVTKEKKVPEEVLKGAETVLVADDDDMILKVGEEMLRAMGYKVMLAKGGREAVEIYKTNKNEVDVVILDMVMPDMGGGEVYDILKEINPDMKVLLSTGYDIDSEAKEILARGCDAFIQKPFGMRELSQRIREMLDKK
jgi:PAS domain S-box-containing protein